MATKPSKTTSRNTRSKSKRVPKKAKKQSWLAAKLSSLSRVQMVGLTFVVLFGVVGLIYTASSFAYTKNATTWNTYAHGLRQCESGNRYSVNTGNGYYGAYQFNLSTWNSVGGNKSTKYPHNASKAVQDYYAYQLFKSRGFQPWSCWNKNISPTRKAWWGNPNHYSSTGSISSGTTTNSTSKNPYTVYCPTGSEKVVGYGRTTTGNCVKKLQYSLNKIQNSGLAVDGSFGPKTLAALKTFQKNKGLAVDGICGPATWSKLNSLYK